MEYNLPESLFVLPGNSSLILTNHPEGVNLKVILSESSKGKLQIPFRLYSVEGEINYTVNDENSKIYLFEGNKLTNPALDIKTIDIKEVKRKTILQYMVNPLLQVFDKERNFLKIESSDSLKVFKTTNRDDFKLPFFNESVLFLNKKQVQSGYFQMELEKIENHDISTKDIEELFSFLIDSDSLIEDIQALYKKFNDFYHEYLDSSLLRKINLYYPKSIFVVFTAIRFDELSEMLD